MLEELMDDDENSAEVEAIIGETLTEIVDATTEETSELVKAENETSPVNETYFFIYLPAAVHGYTLSAKRSYSTDYGTIMFEGNVVQELSALQKSELEKNESFLLLFSHDIIQQLEHAASPVKDVDQEAALASGIF